MSDSYQNFKSSADLQSKIDTNNKLSADLVSGLATVATSGSYSDLNNKPNYGADISANVSGNTLSLRLKDQNGNNLGTGDSVQLPSNNSYPIVTKSSGDTITDRATNVITINSASTLKVPAATSYIRDFNITVDVTSGSLSFLNNDGTTFTSYVYDSRRESNPLTEVLDTNSTYQFYFTEIKTGVFRVELSKLVSPS